MLLSKQQHNFSHYFWSEIGSANCDGRDGDGGASVFRENVGDIRKVFFTFLSFFLKICQIRRYLVDRKAARCRLRRRVCPGTTGTGRPEFDRRSQ